MVAPARAAPWRGLDPPPGFEWAPWSTDSKLNPWEGCDWGEPWPTEPIETEASLRNPRLGSWSLSATVSPTRYFSRNPPTEADTQPRFFGAAFSMDQRLSSAFVLEGELSHAMAMIYSSWAQWSDLSGGMRLYLSRYEHAINPYFGVAGGYERLPEILAINEAGTAVISGRGRPVVRGKAGLGFALGAQDTLELEVLLKHGFSIRGGETAKHFEFALGYRSVGEGRLGFRSDVSWSRDGFGYVADGNKIEAYWSAIRLGVGITYQWGR